MDLNLIIDLTKDLTKNLVFERERSKFFSPQQAREEWKKLISQGWRATQEVWNKPSDN